MERKKAKDREELRKREGKKEGEKERVERPTIGGLHSRGFPSAVG
jgi:hypothetical protein